MKLCKDCKWVVVGVSGEEYAKCSYPKSQGNKAKSGAKLTGFEYASTAGDYCHLSRDEGYIGSWILNYCGRRGRWFEPKENPVAARLIPFPIVNTEGNAKLTILKLVTRKPPTVG